MELRYSSEAPWPRVRHVDYVGTKSTHLDIIRDLNQLCEWCIPLSELRIPGISAGIANGSYNGLETSVQRRFSKGLSLNAAYTWSKSIQTTVCANIHASLSGFDVPQRFVFSYVWELPFGKGKPFLATGMVAALLGGWRTSGVYTYSSGLPFSVTSGSNYSNALDAVWRGYCSAQRHRHPADCREYQLLVLCFIEQALARALRRHGNNAFALPPWTVRECRR